MNKNIKGKVSVWVILIIALVIGLIVALTVNKMSLHSEHGSMKGSHESSKSQEKTSGEKKIKYWTCSMHPQIKMPNNNSLCPLCAMDLIPVYQDGELNGDDSEVSMTLNESARLLAEVQTTEVIYKQPVNEIRLIGKVGYDETRLSYISAWAPGRIDRLFVDYTGIKVREGDHLIELYSPELISAQQEYLQAIKNSNDT